MGDAQKVRDHCIAKYVKPARSKGQKECQIRVGDVSKALGVNSGAVAQALEAARFETIAKVKRMPITGPMRSVNTVITYKLA